MIRHINALGGIENTFESKLFNIKSNQKKWKKVFAKMNYNIF
jgi:hypothetical protein